MARKYPVSQMKSLTVDGMEINLSGIPPADGGSSEGVNPTQKEIPAEIDRVGSTQPDWYASTPLDYPKTLDLTWPLKRDLLDHRCVVRRQPL